MNPQLVGAPARRMRPIHGWTVRLSILLVTTVVAALVTLAIYRSTAAPAAPAFRLVPAPLGIQLPAGMERSNLPPGLPDYLLLSSTSAATQVQPAPLGIDLPAGSTERNFPPGLTDYLRPQPADKAIQAQPAPLGIQLPAGMEESDLPWGLTDYVVPSK